MKRKTIIRTGIDAGTTSLKIVRGTGRTRLESITHIGSQAWRGVDNVEEAAAAAETLLRNLSLNRKQLGRISVNIGGQNTVVREITMPRMNENELRQALPFEAGKYLQLDEGDEVIVDGQITNDGTSEDQEKPGEMSVIMAVTSRKRRERVLQVLQQVGLEPQVIDLEPLACMNALSGAHAQELAETSEYTPARALLDLGGRRASLHVTAQGGGLLSRSIWEGQPPAIGSDAESTFVRQIATRTLETLTFYRGRYRREVEEIFLMGGGALVEGRATALSGAMNRDVKLFDPLGDLANKAKGREECRGHEPVYVTACGLCRWGDDDV